MLVRWLGAFSGSQHTGSASSLSTSLAFELARPASDIVACEAIVTDSKISHALIGLLIHSSKKVREFSYDCWSVKTSKNGLRSTRHHAPSSHREAWASAVYSAVVIKAGATAKAIDEALDFAYAQKLKVLFLQDDKLVNFDRRVYLKKYTAKM